MNATTIPDAQTAVKVQVSEPPATSAEAAHLFATVGVGKNNSYGPRGYIAPYQNTGFAETVILKMSLSGEYTCPLIA